jgi:hypothetical protein
MEACMYRLAAVPAAFTSTDNLLLEDERGRLFVLERDGASLEPVEERDENLIMSFYEASQDATWRSADDVTRLFCRNVEDGAGPGILVALLEDVSETAHAG